MNTNRTTPSTTVDTIQPPLWYGPDWAPEGSWLWVPEHLREQYALLGPISNSQRVEFVTFASLGQPEPRWRLASTIPAALPEAVTIGASTVAAIEPRPANEPGSEHHRKVLIHMVEAEPQERLWARLAFADNEAGLACWVHPYRLAAAREAQAQADAAAAMKAALYGTCPACGGGTVLQGPMRGPRLESGHVLCVPCGAAAEMVRSWAWASQPGPDGGTIWEALARLTAQEGPQSHAAGQ